MGRKGPGDSRTAAAKTGLWRKTAAVPHPWRAKLRVCMKSIHRALWTGWQHLPRWPKRLNAAAKRAPRRSCHIRMAATSVCRESVAVPSALGAARAIARAGHIDIRGRLRLRRLARLVQPFVIGVLHPAGAGGMRGIRAGGFRAGHGRITLVAARPNPRARPAFRQGISASRASAVR